MKRKTAMMEFIEWILNNGMNPDCGVPDIKLKAQQLLEKEKEQIMDAYDKGMYSSLQYNKSPRQYYNETYKQD